LTQTTGFVLEGRVWLITMYDENKWLALAITLKKIPHLVLAGAI
jgi:hypothetical protein